MRATIESTAQIAYVDGARCRVWTAVTESGTRFTLYVRLVQVDLSEVSDLSEFDGALIPEGYPVLHHAMLGDAIRENEALRSFGEQMEEVLAAKSRALLQIAAIIEGVDNRAAAADGPVTPTLQEMTQGEISCIYAIARSGQPAGVIE